MKDTFAENVLPQSEKPQMLGNVVKRTKIGVVIEEASNGVVIRADEWKDEIRERIEKCPKADIKTFV